MLYFGDHPYSDLADVSLNHGWRTGAIIWELDVSSYTLFFCCLLLISLDIAWLYLQIILYCIIPRLWENLGHIS